MNRLVVIGEGQTEQTFVRDVLAAHLAVHGTIAWAVLGGPGRHRGGVEKWEVARQDIIRTLKKPGQFCSTMFDYYALPADWPGRAASAGQPWNERAAFVEQQILADVTAAMGRNFRPEYFIPYIQLHEFEALAFADVATLVSVVSPLDAKPRERLIEELSDILEEAGHPEAINDSYETCPSRRISKVVPAYRKRVFGPTITSRIGLNVLKEKCNHFASWIQRLEQLKTEN